MTGIALACVLMAAVGGVPLGISLGVLWQTRRQVLALFILIVGALGLGSAASLLFSAIWGLLLNTVVGLPPTASRSALWRFRSSAIVQFPLAS